jgi:hypothetical protein
MAGLVPAIHVFLTLGANKTWMPGTSPGMTKQLTDQQVQRFDHRRSVNQVRRQAFGPDGS